MSASRVPPKTARTHGSRFLSVRPLKIQRSRRIEKGIRRESSSSAEILVNPLLHGTATLGPHRALVNASLESLASKKILERIWAHDHTVWGPEGEDIRNRLDWLHAPETIFRDLPWIKELADDVRAAGFRNILLLGMGGSSLAADVFARVFGHRDGFPELHVLDTIHPDVVAATSLKLDLQKTLVIVSSKSGRTIETISLMKYFYGRIADTVGKEKVSDRFVAITDPGSDLASIADRFAFRARILNNPNIGGRFSALSYEGLVPAALMGIELPRLLENAVRGTAACGPSVEPRENPGAWMGAILGELAKMGRDKATFVISSEIASFGDWAEQLVAESTGKEGKGILPVVGERLTAPAAYLDDRLFISLQLDEQGCAPQERALAELEAAGHPIVRLRVDDLYELGLLFFVWEMAVAVACHCIGVNPFDQPNVESTKAEAMRMISGYRRSGRLPAPRSTSTKKNDPIVRETPGKDLGIALVDFLSTASPADYVAIQAYVDPTVEKDKSALNALRRSLMLRSRLATTIGYGPRFLHSTGQLHKGDRGRGLFVQITTDQLRDVPIPDALGSPESSMSFGVLLRAEALGDRRALLNAGRRVITFQLTGGVSEALTRMRRTIESTKIPIHGRMATALEE